jgi:hypothetical protein
MAMLLDLAAIAAHRAHQAVASCAGSLPSHLAYCHRPNIALQLTPTASLLVPSATLRRR